MAFGGMERLFSTPLSPTYMRHTSRGLFLFLFLLPCGLVAGGCSSLPALVAATCSAGYVSLGIDEIGVQIEQPFEAMPLHGLATALTRDVAEELYPLAPLA